MVGQQTAEFAFIDRIEQLAADAAVAPFVAGLVVGSGGRENRGVMVAFGQLGGDELVEHLDGLGEAHRAGGFGSGVERVAAATVGEGDDVTFALGFDGGVIHLVGVALAVVERGGLDGGCGVHVGCVCLGWVLVVGRGIAACPGRDRVGRRGGWAAGGGACPPGFGRRAGGPDRDGGGGAIRACGPAEYVHECSK